MKKNIENKIALNSRIIVRTNLFIKKTIERLVGFLTASRERESEENSEGGSGKRLKELEKIGYNK